jgi:urease accessory protein
MFSGIASLGRVAPRASVPKSAFGHWAWVCELRVRGTSAVLILAALNSSAFAHVGAHTSGLADGLAHPFSGLDHVLAMVAVGLWASQLGRPAYWLLPLTFPAVMAFGAAMGASGMPLPWIEIALAGSVLVLGLAIALPLRPAIVASTALIALFAVIHGHAHGTELPQSAAALAYGSGFIGATLVLHALGLALGSLSRGAAFAPRAAGAVGAAVGAVLLVMA